VTVRVAVAMGLRGKLPAVENCVVVEAMEWGATGRTLRQGRVVGESDG
jgi:hypothetical protein